MKQRKEEHFYLEHCIAIFGGLGILLGVMFLENVVYGIFIGAWIGFIIGAILDDYFNKKSRTSS